MAITGNYGNSMTGESPELKQLKAERKRIQGYIRAYGRNPKNWSNNMIMQLEQMAAQYQVPFKRVIPEASLSQQALALGGGVADSVALGFLPDKLYTDESTRTAANVGKIGGSLAQIAAAIGLTIASGGAAAPTIGKGVASLGSAIQGARGLAGAANIAKAAGKLAVTIPARMPVGQMTSGAIRGGAQALAPYGAKKGWNWAKGVQEGAARSASAKTLKEAASAIDNTGDLAKVVKGKNLSAEQVKLLTGRITRKYGKNSKVGENFLEQLKASKSVDALTGVTTTQIVDMANKMVKTHNVNSANVKKLLGKVGANSSDDNVKVIVDRLKEANLTKLNSKAVAEILKLVKGPGKGPGPASLADIDKWGALGSLGLGAGAGMSLADYTPSREDLEKQEDPFDPYNI